MKPTPGKNKITASKVAIERVQKKRLFNAV